MAFFGSDGLEHQLKQLKSQISSKGMSADHHEITSIRNELRKRLDELNEAVKTKETAQYTLQTEAERAHKAEEALQTKTTELSTIRLQYDNLESSLTAANQKLQAGAKANGRLQYDLDTSSGTLKDENIALQSRVAELQGRLDKAEQSQKAVKRTNVDFFGNSLSPAPKRSNRRRSTSLSADNRVSELEAEIQALRSASGPSTVEMDKLNTQLANARRDLDRATNAKLALERSSKRELEELRSQLEDANFELEDRRRNSESGGGAEVERAKKNAHKDVLGLQGRIAELEAQVEEKERRGAELQEEVNRLQESQQSVERDQTAVNLEDSAVKELEGKIVLLEGELAQARATSSAAAPISADRVTRQLQRENKTLKAENESLKEDLQMQDDEILRLRGAIPLPGSPSLSPSTSADMGQVASLEAELDQARQDVLGLKVELDEVHAKQVTREGELQALEQEKAKVASSLSEAEARFTSSESRVTGLEEQLRALRADSDEDQRELSAARQDAADLREMLAEHQENIERLNGEQTDLIEKLAGHEQLETETARLRDDLAQKEQLIAGLEASVSEDRSRMDELETSAAAAQVQLAEAVQTSSTLKEEVSSLMERLTKAEDGLNEAVEEKTTAVQAIRQKLKENMADTGALRSRLENAQHALEQAAAHSGSVEDKFEETLKEKLDLESILNELRETIANRSTESEARHRDEEVFDLRETADQLQRTLETERAEHARELESAAFVAQKDLEEARGKLTQLDEAASIRAKSTDASAKQVRMLQDKISRLRKERDELRVSLNFINHESRFQQQAADSEKISSIAALNDARKELEATTARYEEVEREQAAAQRSLTELTSRLENVNHDLATTSTEKTAMTDQLAQIEMDLRQASTSRQEMEAKVAELEGQMTERLSENQAQAAEAHTLVNELALARSKASRAEAQLAGIRKANKDLEIHVDRLRATLEVRSERDMVSGGGEEKERPSSVLGHNRRKSGIPSPTFDMLEALRVERADLLGRISRRDDRITGLANELKQAKVNLQLAEEAASDNSDEKDEVFQQISELQASLDQKSSQLSEAQAELATARTESASLEERISSLSREVEQAGASSQADRASLRQTVVTLAMHYKVVLETRRHWHVRMRSLKESDDAIERIHSSATFAMEGAKNHIADLNEQLHQAQQGLAEAQAAETSLRSDTENMRDSLLQAETRLEAASADGARLETVKRDMAEVQHKLAEAHDSVTAKEVEIANMTSRLAAAEDALATSQADAAGQHASLETELEDTRKEVAAKEADIASLRAEFAETEQARGASEQERSNRLASMETDLDNARSRINSLEVELETLHESLAELEKAHDEMLEMHEKGIAALKADHASVLVSSEQSAVDLRAKTAELEEARQKLSAVEGDLATSTTQLRDMQDAAKAQGARLNDLQRHTADSIAQHEQLETLKTAAAALNTENTALRSQIAELESTSSAKFEEITSLRAEMLSRGHEIEGLQAHIVSLEAAIQSAEEGRDQQLSRAAELDAALRLREADESKLKSDVSSAMNRVTELETTLYASQTELEVARARAEAASTASAELESSIYALRTENEDLQERLAQSAPVASPVASEGATELQERIDGKSQHILYLEQADKVAELEATLTLKVQEVDEADDRVREAYKDKTKLEKKVAKLQRQLAAASPPSETALNTAANKHIVAPSPTEMPPPPVPTTSARSAVTPQFTPQTATSNSTPSSRRPLQATGVNIFDVKPSPSGLKRAREEKGDEKPLPAECILLPPASISMEAQAVRKISPRAAFTPSRGNKRESIDAHVRHPRVNVFAEHNDV